MWRATIPAAIVAAAATVALVHLARNAGATDVRTAVRQLLPRPPEDQRPQLARQAIEQRRFSEAIAILEDYLDDHPDDGDARVQLGWAQYRIGQFEKSRTEFETVLRKYPQSEDARVGLGFATLQTSGGDAGAKWFRQVLAKDALHRDALEGMVLAGRRQPVSRRVAVEALDAARKLESLSKTFRPELLPTGSERRLRGPASAEIPLSVPARAIRDYIEIADNGGWRPVFLKGFNLGVALPGRFPSEFPTDEKLYREWLETIASLGMNAVRLYTLLPPEFYRALKTHNATHPDAHLWLLQGVWTELPPRYDFSDPDYVAALHAEIARVIDAVHGNLLLGPRPGHAFGAYDADASGSVLAYIVGREWEPFAVVDYNRMHAGQTSFRGTWFEVENGRAMECWVASICDFAAQHESEHYRVLRPLTFANWPTLDPLTHPTESTRTEEDRWRERNGIPFPRKLRAAPWEDDAIALDATLIRPTPANAAGFFAAYHIYPNFPDFMNLEPAYALARDHAGPSRYAGYLAALKAYHGEQPVLVAEFGISTSRGIAHVHPQGWHHGGKSEKEQGALVARMLRNIHDARYAGGIVFEFMDEWFKSTWSVAPFESPADRRRMWFNAESPEQSYGVMAARPGRRAIVIDGRTNDWTGVPVLSAD
ncbi:MAG TPA: tetratricopeptide repeat protein [Thermoanaerobaculia bacterium]|nr:tetratricopeptide repeat protein [Thermoanaerobaculia bacterium]